MSLEIATDNTIILDGHPTALKVTQTGQGTVVYSPESISPASKYREHDMPHFRYSLTHDNPKPNHATQELAAKYPVAGRAKFESDLRELLSRLKVAQQKATT